MKLTEVEESLKPEDLFLKWLLENRVDFTKLSDKYVKYLEIQNNRNSNRISNYVNLLAQFEQYANLSNKNEWIKDKTIGTLYAYGDFKSAPVYKVWEEIIKNKNINTDINTISWKTYKEE